MGCGCVRKKIELKRTTDNSNITTSRKEIQFAILDEGGSDLLRGSLNSTDKPVNFTEFVNKLCFDSEYIDQVDANFTARVTAKNTVEYKIERLLGKYNKTWFIYLNSQLLTLNHAINEDFPINSGDMVTFSLQALK